MVPHLLSPPRAVVVGRRERLGKEGCWGAGWTLKAGSRCERLQDSGAGHRPWGSRSLWTQEPVLATGRDGRGEGRRLGCRGPRLQSPRRTPQGRHFHQLSLLKSDFSLLFHLRSLFWFPRHVTTFPPPNSEGFKVSFLSPSDLRRRSVPEGRRFSGTRAPPWPCPRRLGTLSGDGALPSLAAGLSREQLQTASLPLKAFTALPSSPRSPPDPQISFPFNQQSLPIFFKKPFPQGVMFFYLF